ncbi:MAG: T9SS type A sorting domain-containing protein, partial [Ignavibacteriales bacterium]|nr:T9SS type A sorting domain-containing protein [Ignavibacteriales bacterium]
IPFGVAGTLRYGDSLSITHLQGQGTGRVKATVVNPLASTGVTYEVHFDSATGGLLWSLQNVSKNRLVVSGQPLHSGPDGPPIVEGGISLLVSGSQTSDDVYSYSLPQLDSSLTVQKISAGRVGVFPNPATAESYVTFNNLPKKVIIAIYNLAGHLVRTLRKDDPSQFLQWNLTNEHNRQVGSGMYICLVEMPELDETKILKLAVIQPQLYPGVR